MSKLKAQLEQFKQALERFEEVLKMEKTDVVRDSAIQRFEFSFDLAWKMTKTFLEEQRGVVCASPKGCFRDAFQQSLIDYDEKWIDMTDMRNQTAHAYSEKMAEKIYKELLEVLPLFQGLLGKIQKEIPGL